MSLLWRRRPRIPGLGPRVSPTSREEYHDDATRADDRVVFRGSPAMTIDRDCRILAEKFLADYRLSPAERLEETDRLAQAIQQTAEAELENLEHRKTA